MDKVEDRQADALPGVRATIASIVGYWLFYYAIVTLRGLVMGYDDQLWMMALRAIVTLASIGATWLVWLVLRIHAARSLRAGVIASALLCAPAALFYATVNHYAFMQIEADHVSDGKVDAEIERGAERDIDGRAGDVLIDGDGGIVIRDKDGSVVISPRRRDRQPSAGAADNGIVTPPRPPLPPPPPETTSIQVGGSDSKWEEKDPVLAIADQAANGYFFFAAWCALFMAMANATAVRAAERQAARFRAAAQAAELRALRYQVNPHFLFNTLNSLSSLIMAGRQAAAERMIMNLATFFRTSLTGDPTEDVPLYEEIRLQRLYLDIETARFPDRLRIDIALPDDLRTACVPGLILQPIVENAVKYGVSPSRRPVTIRIRAREDTRGLVLTVEDDGDVPPQGGEGGTGVGLRNVRDRLAARFGDKARCDWGWLPEGGFVVTLAMPFTRDAC